MKRILLSAKQVINEGLKNKKTKTTKKICITGVSSKAGATHLSVSIANYLNSVLRKKVIYIEFSEDSSLLSVVGLKQVKIGNIPAYKYKGVIYVLTNDVNLVMEILAHEKGWIIVDLNCIDDTTKPIILSCDNKIITGSLNPWRQKEYYSFLDELIEKNIAVHQVVLLQFNKKKNSDKFIKENYKNIPIEMPYIEDPFSLKEQDFDFLNQLIM